MQRGVFELVCHFQFSPADSSQFSETKSPYVSSNLTPRFEVPMKRAWSRAEKLLLLSPLTIIGLAGGVWAWQKSLPQSIEFPEIDRFDSFLISPDGQKLAVFFKDQKKFLLTGQVYEVESGAKICDLTPPPLNSKRIGARQPYITYHSKSWSPDGTRIVAAYEDETYGPNQIPVLPELRSLGQPSFRNNMVGKFAIWNASNGVLQGNYPYAPITEDSSSEVRFTKDGKKIIGYGKPPARFDANTGQRTETFQTNYRLGRYSAPNDELGLLAIMSEDKSRLQVVDRKTKRVVWNWRGNRVARLIWGEHVLAIIDAEQPKRNQAWIKGRLILWDGKNHKLLPTPPESSATSYDFPHFSADGHSLLIRNTGDPRTFRSADTALLLWDYRQNRVMWQYRAEGYLGIPQWSPNGQWISVVAPVTLKTNQRLLVFDRAGKLHLETSIQGDRPVWSPDSRRIAIVRQEPGSMPRRIDFIAV
ncbi:hypothetical protein EON80_19545, partial [bacterium]